MKLNTIKYFWSLYSEILTTMRPSLCLGHIEVYIYDGILSYTTRNQCLVYPNPTKKLAQDIFLLQESVRYALYALLQRKILCILSTAPRMLYLNSEAILNLYMQANPYPVKKNLKQLQCWLHKLFEELYKNNPYSVGSVNYIERYYMVLKEILALKAEDKKQVNQQKVLSDTPLRIKEIPSYTQLLCKMYQVCWRDTDWTAKTFGMAKNWLKTAAREGTSPREDLEEVIKRWSVLVENIRDTHRNKLLCVTFSFQQFYIHRHAILLFVTSHPWEAIAIREQ